MYTKPNFWAVLIFCVPDRQQVACTELDEHLQNKKKYPVTFSMKTGFSLWNSTFNAHNVNREEIVKKLDNDPNPMAGKLCTNLNYGCNDTGDHSGSI